MCLKFAQLWRYHPDLNRGIKVLQTFALPLGYGTIHIICKTTVILIFLKRGRKMFICVLSWSGLRGSNSLPPPWQGGALPDELNPHLKNMKQDKLYRGTPKQRIQHILWCLRTESNHRHGDFQSPALPTELQRHIGDPEGTRTLDL